MKPTECQQVVEVPFSLRDSPSRTTVWDVGQIEPARQQPGLRIPVNYRASCQSFLGLGRAAKMETAASPQGAGIACTVTVQDSMERFEGSNPTAAMVAAALAHGSNQYMHGVQAFGIANPVVQRKLQQPVPDAATASAEAGRSSMPEAAKQQACSAPAFLAAAAPEQQQNGNSTAAAEPADAAAAGAVKAGGSPDQPASPSVLVQTAALPPLQLIKQMQDMPAQPSQQQRVVQTGATAASAGPNVGGSTAACSRSPLPPVRSLRLPPQQPAASAADTPVAAPTTPPSAVKLHPQIELFKPSPTRATAASASAGDSAAEHLAPQPGSQQQQQGLPHFAGFAMPPGLPQNGLPSAQPQPGGAFTPFSAGLQPPPAFLTASPMSPFMAARVAAGASSAGLHSAQLLQLPQLSVPSWSGSNYSCSSMMSPSVFGSSLGASNGASNGGSGNHAGALEAASIDLRSHSNGSFGSLSSLSRGSWGSLHPGSASIGSSPLLNYFGHLAASRGAAGWDPIAVAALTNSAARLSSNESAIVRALADAAAADVAAAGGGSGVDARARSLPSSAAASAVVAGKRPGPRVTAAAPAAASAAAPNAEGDALEQQPPPRGRLTPEALSQGAAAAEGLLTSQGLLNPSAATVKAPRMAAKGWTVFTAFGLHTRDAVRSANPGATSIEVEKLVGQLWGRLSRDEKQGWVQRAARARSARGAGGGSSQAKAKRKRPAPAAEAVPQHDSGAESPSIHRRKRSSRIRRPPAHHDGAETSEGHDISPKSPQGALAAGGAAGGATGGGVSGSPRAAFGPANGSSRVTASARAGVSAGVGGSVGGISRSAGGGGGGGHIAGASMPKSQAAADLEMEVGTLEVLASMQAAAADSRRGFLA